jgi:hypothetical protein
MTAMAFVFAAGCSEPAPQMREVTISGSATLPDGTNPPGTLHVQAYFAWTGEGELRHPLGELGGFTGQSAGFRGTVSYPAGGGEGLVIHAWLDADGDGVHCTPANRSEPAGIAVVEAIPEGEARVSIALTENCAAAYWFFPPKAS